MVTTSSMPALVNANLEVPLCTGGTRRYVNLDNAASSPAMQAVADAVNQALPWYSSVHRGAGFPSRVATAMYEAARERIGAFVGAGPDHVVIIVRNTTDALNHLARCMAIGEQSVVVTTEVEHHANLLPWRRVARVVHVPPPATAAALLADLDTALQANPVAMVAVTGASNVTGEVFPLRQISELAHRHGALLTVDAAQLAPHRAIDMVADGIDCLALSGHKMYAPFGAGALIAPAALLRDSEPFLAGGGAVDFVTLDSVIWTGLPDRLEAGSPNVIGAIALAAACSALDTAGGGTTGTGMAVVANHERALLAQLEARLERIDRLTMHRLWADADRVGICTFTVADMSHALVAGILSAEHGIGVRHGCFCAHPYITHLLGIDATARPAIVARLVAGERAGIPGAVRASFGIGTTEDDVDRLATALEDICSLGPQLDYVEDSATGDFEPVGGDTRPMPVIDGLPPMFLDERARACGQY